MATLTFTAYEILDEGIRFVFAATAPIPGHVDADYAVTLLQGELDGVSTALQLRTLLEAKLRRKLRGETIASKLDPFIGQTLTIPD